jgi:hypothetical protein
MFSDEQGRPDGSGVLVSLKNADEIAKGLRKVFENLTEIGTKAYIKGAALRWSVVGKQYVNLLYDVALKPSEIERAKIHFTKEGSSESKLKFNPKTQKSNSNPANQPNGREVT